MAIPPFSLNGSWRGVHPAGMSITTVEIDHDQRKVSVRWLVEIPVTDVIVDDSGLVFRMRGSECAMRVTYSSETDSLSLSPVLSPGSSSSWPTDVGGASHRLVLTRQGSSGDPSSR